MTTAVDLPLLEALKGPSVSLLTRTRVKAAGSGEVYTGFSVLDHLNVALRVDDVSGDSGSSVTVLVEHSDDGDVWSTAATHTFTANGTYRVVVDAPKDQLRASWTVTAGLRDAVVGSVSVVPGFLDHSDGGTLAPPVTITGEAPAETVMTIRGAEGQSVDIFRVEKSDGTPILDVSPIGEVAADFIGVDVIDTGAVEVFASLNEVPGVAIYQGAEHTKAALEVQAPGSVVLARILAGGALMTAQNAVPADADLEAGQMSIWFDQTNGAAKLKIKAKQADGTVVTGSVNLA